MTVSGLTITDAQYIRIGPLVFFKIQASLTLGGTASTAVIASLPVTVAGQASACTAMVHGFGLNWQPGYGLIDNATSTCRVSLSNEANYALGAAIVMIEGFYRV
jgi:hypothetical protein